MIKNVQTFYISPELVRNSGTVLLTSIELYFKTKPLVTSTLPSVYLSICEVNNNEPLINSILPGSLVKLHYNQINSSTNSLDSTIFQFSRPIVLGSNKSYGIVVSMESDGFSLWENVVGQRIIDSLGNVSESVSSGSTLTNGNLYKTSGDSSVLTPLLNSDLKFKVNVAKFNLTTPQKIISLTTKNYEFFTLSNIEGSFRGGETVFLNGLDESGTVSLARNSKIVTGSGTNFTSILNNRNIVLSNSEVLKVVTVVSDSSLEIENFPLNDYTGTFKVVPTGSLYTFDNVSKKMILSDSTASDFSFRFTNGSEIIGARSGARAVISSVDKRSVDMFTPKMNISNPSTGSVSIRYKFVDQTGTIFPAYSTMDNNVLNEVNNYDAYVMSRSLEVVQPIGTLAYGDSKKSSVVEIILNDNSGRNSSFTAPIVDAATLDLFVVENNIVNSTNESRTINSVEFQYDTETGRFGVSPSKYISRKINLAQDKLAEDLKVFVSGYRPIGTDIQVYAKISNPLDREPFDDKSWTRLDNINGNVFSSQFDNDDIREYEYSIPRSPEFVNGLLEGVVLTTANNSNIVNTSSDLSGSLVVGDSIKIYNAINERDNFEVFSIVNVSSSNITLNRKVLLNANITGTVFGRLVKYKNSAFVNPANDYIVRYVSNEQVDYDGFSSMQIKIVMVSDSTYKVPKVDNIQILGVSA